MIQNRHLQICKWAVGGALGLALVLGSIGPSASVSYAAESGAAKSPVTITLVDEPLLRGMNEVDVYRGKAQSFRLVFGQAVNRTSIQNKLRNQVKAFAAADTDRIIPQFKFDWRSDKELILTATAAQASDYDQYLISVAGVDGGVGQLVVNLLPQTSLYTLRTDNEQVGRVSGLADHPYDEISLIDVEDGYLLLDRRGWKKAGERYAPVSADSLLDLENGKRTDYPLDLTTNYTGVGSFFADERGVFYPATAEALRATQNDDVERFKIVTKRRVYGAVYSQDRQSVIAVLGDTTPSGKFDLLIQPLNGDSPTLRSAALQGYPYWDEFGHSYAPVSIVDDGEDVHIWLASSARQDTDIEWVYRGSNQTVMRESIEDSVAEQPVFAPSQDGLYRYYATGSMYDTVNKTFDLLPAPWFGYWLDDTHQFIYSQLPDDTDASGYSRQIAVYDADEESSTIIAENLPDAAEFVGATDQQIYLSSRQPLR